MSFAMDAFPFRGSRLFFRKEQMQRIPRTVQWRSLHPAAETAKKNSASLPSSTARIELLSLPVLPALYRITALQEIRKA